MTKQELRIMQGTIEKTIKETVNGKIDALRAQITEHNIKHEADMEEIKPYIQGVKGLGFVWKIAIALGGGILLLGQIKQYFPSI